MKLEPPEELLAQLVDAPDGTVLDDSGDAVPDESGDAVPDDLGASPGDSSAAVRPHGAGSVQAARRVLVERGHVICDLDARRARLECARVHFSPRRFAQAVRGRLGRRLEVWERIDSTNRRGLDGADAGAAEGSVWVAEEQTAGRGRRGHAWLCPPHAGLLFTLLLRPPRSGAGPLQLLPLLAALGVCEVLRGCTGADVRLKWPNDVWLGEHKLAGVLAEARSVQEARAVVVGCGLNLHVDAGWLRARGVARAGSLARWRHDLPPREVILADILAAVEQRYDHWTQGHDAELLETWRGLDVLIGRDVRAGVAGATLHARVLDISATGELVLRARDGTIHRLAAGEVHLL